MTNPQTNHAQNFYKNSTFTKIQLENGKESSITVLFNNSEISFEEINRFLKNAITQTTAIKTHQTTFGTLKDGTFKPSAVFGLNIHK